MRTLIVFLTVFTVSLTTTTSAHVEDSTSVLSGLGQVTVRVADIDLEDGTKDTVAREIEADVISKLRTSGLMVIDAAKSAYLPEFEIREQSVRLGGLTVSNLRVVLTQYAKIPRAPKDDLLKRVVTWEKSAFGIYGTGNFAEELHKKANQLVDSFVDEYLLANSPTTSGEEPVEANGYRPIEASRDGASGEKSSE